MPAMAPSLSPGTLEAAAARVATLLAGAGTGLSDRTLTSLEFEPTVSPLPLERNTPPADVWAVDGGQALVADARCLQVVATRASRVRFQRGSCVLEEEGELRAHVLAGADERTAAIAALDVPDMAADTAVDVNLLRDRWEWEAVERSVGDAEAGGLVLVDGDLLPDWRIPTGFIGRILARAAHRGVLVAGITKHSSLSRGGAPLVGQLEVEAAGILGPRALWWAPIAHSKTSDAADSAATLQVVAARLDPDARFAFRIDLPAGADPAAALGAISALCDDAAFPGYPYPLTVADRLAACPGWVRQEAGLRLDELLAQAGIAQEVRERAFSDRHRLMERA
ncbi:MAG TPA: DNA double-strand break repair nuclease NurA [Acidimicrobiales bacterium]|nr:DNA double-strand break repair nuclease NurA [Acidimicrobiales bacterium]